MPSQQHEPQNTLIVSHGITIRLFLMRWFHWTVEEFECLRNLDNCEYYILKRQPSYTKTGHYKIDLLPHQTLYWKEPPPRDDVYSG
jgi:broad specificity phosphatase PhoE